MTEPVSKANSENPAPTHEQIPEEGGDPASDKIANDIKSDEKKPEEEQKDEPVAAVFASEGETEGDGLNDAEEVNSQTIIITEFETGHTNAADALDAGTIVLPKGILGGDEALTTASGTASLTFQLEVQDGWKETPLTVEYRIQKEDGRITDNGIKYEEDWQEVSESGGTYTIARNDDNGLKGTDRRECFTGPIEIRVIGERNTASLVIDASVAGGAYLDGYGPDNTNKLLTGTESAIPFANFTKEITLLAKAKADETLEMKVTSEADATFSPMTRGADVDVVGDEEKWTQFTIDPRTLAGYAGEASAAAPSFTVRKTIDNPDFTYALSNEAGKYTFAVADADDTAKIPTLTGVRYFTLTAGSPATAPAATDRRNYLKTGNNTNVLVFEVTHATNTEVTGAKAELSLDSDPVTGATNKLLDTIKATERTYADGSGTYYEISLAAVDSALITGDVTLTLKADTVYNSETDNYNVHKITFAGDNVDVKGSITAADYSDDDVKVLDTSFDTDAEELLFGVKAKEGYKIAEGTDYNSSTITSDVPVVTVSYTKQYELTSIATGNPKVYDVKTKTRESKELKLTEVSDGVYKLVASQTGFTDASSKLLLKNTAGDQAWKTLPGVDTTAYTEATNAPFSYKDIIITINTTTETNQSGKFNVVSEKLDYTVETGKGVEAGDTANTYTISEDAEFVILNVTSPGGAPKVVYKGTGNVDVTVDEKAMVKNGDSYQIKIPVSKLNDADTTNHGADSNIDSTITITEDTYSFTIKTDGVANTFNGKLKVGNDTKESTKYTYSQVTTGPNAKNVITRGETVPVILYAETGTAFKTVKVVTGTGAGKTTEDITLGDDKTVAELSLAMTDNVEIQITTDTVYGVVLTRDPAATPIEKGEDGVYVIPVGAKNIQATLYQGETTNAANKKAIAYARLYDGGREAASTVTLVDSNKTAKIAQVSEKDTGVLRLDLAVKNGNKISVVASVQMRQEQAASKMSIINPEDGSVVTEYTAAPDTKKVEYKVKAEEGNLTFADSSIKLELAKDAGKVSAEPVPGDNTEVDISDLKIKYNKATGVLGITVKPGVEGNKSYILRFYDNEKRAEAAKNNAADRVCAVEGGTININITAPAVKNAGFTAQALDATNTTLRIQVASNDVVLDPDNHNNVFYRVTLDSKDKLGATGKDAAGNTETIPERVKYYQRTGDSQILEFKVNPTKTTRNEDYSDPQTFHPTVELVQTTYGEKGGDYVSDKDIDTDNSETNKNNKKSNEDAAEKQAGINKLAKSDAIALTTATKEARYEHKLSLSPDKADVYLGQKEATATTAQFGEKTGFAAVGSLEFVNIKTGARRGNAGDDITYCGIRAKIGRNGEITIGAENAQAGNLKKYPDWYKDLGLKVSAAAGSNDTNPASAILSISVVAGVANISFENGYNQNILKMPGKAATLKIKAMVNEGLKENAPKNKKFVYALGDAAGRLPEDKGYTAPSDQVLSYVSVNQKNGTVTVKKDFAVDKKDANNRFSVVAKEIYSNQRAYVTITVTEVAQSVSRVVIVDGSGNVVAADGVLKADDFYGKDLYVRALTSTAGTKRTYKEIDFQTPNSDYMTGVKYTSSAKNDLAVNAATGQLTLLKTPKKAVKLKAASADGSKDKGMSIDVTVQGFSAVGLKITGNETGVDNTNKYSDPAVSYDGALNSIFTLQPVVKVNGAWQVPKQNYFNNWDIKIKQAKKVKLEKTATWWRIVKTSGTATVTITDKTNKSAAMTYTIAQQPQVDAKVKAPKIKAVTKLTQTAVDGARNAANQKDGAIPLLFQITGKVSYGKKSVMITPDYTKNKLLNKRAGSEEYNRANEIFFNRSNAAIVKVSDDNSFTLPLTMWHRSNSEVVPGTYTLIATIGTYQNGKFVPETKGASVKVKIPGKAPKTLSLQLNGNYELDESGVPVDLATGISSGYKWSLVGTENNYVKNMIDPETGKANKFTTFFEVKRKADVNGTTTGYTLGLKGSNKFEDIAELRENPKDCQGYVTVSTDDGQRQDMLITVTLKDSEITSMTKDSYKGAEATVQFYAGGSSEPLELAGVCIDKKASQGAPSFVVTTGGHVSSDDKKNVKIKLGSAEKDNSYEVTFKVLPAESAYAKASNKPATMTEAYVEKYGRTVTATFYVVDPAKADGAVWFEPVDEETGLAFTAFSTETYDKSRNTYSLDIKQKSAIDGAVVSAAKIGTKKEDGSAFAGTTVGISIRKKTGSSDVFTLTLDRDKFLKAANGENSIFGRGEEVAIPVELTYTNREIPAETVYVPVVMPDPMNVQAAVTAAQGAVADVEQIRVIDLVNRDVSVGTTIKAVLQNKVNDALMKAVPLDAVAYTNLPTTIQDDKDEKGTVIGWKADLEIKEKKTDASAKWSYTLKFEEEKSMPTDSGLLREIRALDAGYDGSAAAVINAAKINGIANNDHKLDNDYSADKLKADILKLLNRKTLPADLDIVIENFKIKKATVLANGKVTAEIKVYNAKTKVTSPNRGQFEQGAAGETAYGKAKIHADITIDKLGSIGVNGGQIADAVDTYDPDTKKGIDYQTVIYNAMSKAGADLKDVEDALVAAIEKAANNAITNSDVSVEFEAIELVGGSFSNKDIHAVSDKREIGFKLPTAAANGSVEFKLKVTQTGMKDYFINRTTGNTPGAITVSNIRKDKDNNDTYPFQTLTEANTTITATSNTLFASSSGTPAVYTLAKSIDKAEKKEIAEEIEKMAAELLKDKGEFFEYDVDTTTIRVVADGANVDSADEITPGSAAGDMKGTLTVTDKFAREAAKTYNFTGEVPANAKTITGVKLSVTRKDGSKAAKVVTVSSGTPDTASVAAIGTDDCVITIKPELEGYWLAGDKGSYQIKAYTNSDYSSDEITGTASGGLSINNGVITVEPDDVTNPNSALDIYVTVAARLSSDTGAFPTDGNPGFKKLKITCTFATPTTAAAEIETLTLTGVVVKYQSNAAGNAWEVTADDQTALATAVQTKLRAVTGYEDFTVVCSTDTAIAFTGTYGTDDAPTAIKVKFKANRQNGAAGDAVETTNTVDFNGAAVKPTAKQEEADDIVDAVEALVGDLEENTAAASTLNTADAVKDYIDDVAGVTNALDGATITVGTPTVNSTVVTATFTVKPVNGVKSKTGTIQITCQS